MISHYFTLFIILLRFDTPDILILPLSLHIDITYFFGFHRHYWYYFRLRYFIFFDAFISSFFAAIIAGHITLRFLSLFRCFRHFRFHFLSSFIILMSFAMLRAPCLCATRASRWYAASAICHYYETMPLILPTPFLRLIYAMPPLYFRFDAMICATRAAAHAYAPIKQRRHARIDARAQARRRCAMLLLRFFDNNIRLANITTALAFNIDTIDIEDRIDVSQQSRFRLRRLH